MPPSSAPADPYSLPLRSATICPPRPPLFGASSPARTRNFGRIHDEFPVPDLTEIQTRSYERFLQADAPPERREPTRAWKASSARSSRSRATTRRSSSNTSSYDLGKPRYDPDECRQLRLTYGRPLHVWLRLNKGETAIEESVYLGDMPIMIGGGEFIINGAERVVVSQLHRSPGRRLRRRDRVERQASCTPAAIIPERGSWIELQVTKKDTLGVRIDQSGKFSAMTLLRAMSPEYSDRRGDPPGVLRDRGRSRLGRPQGRRHARRADRLRRRRRPRHRRGPDRQRRDDLQGLGADPRRRRHRRRSRSSRRPSDPLILNSLQEDPTTDHESALLRIYQRLRPGNPPQLEKASELFHEKFFDANRYRLGKVGRFRINRKFDQDVPEDEMTLRPEDYVNAIRYILNLRDAARAHVDDIDHLGNRRLRTIDELAADELRKGFLKLRRTVQERMSLKDAEDMTPRSLINPKSISAAIEYFFGRGELSQVVDQTNPLTQLTHERRLSALGPAA